MRILILFIIGAIRLIGGIIALFQVIVILPAITWLKDLSLVTPDMISVLITKVGFLCFGLLLYFLLEQPYNKLKSDKEESEASYLWVHIIVIYIVTIGVLSYIKDKTIKDNTPITEVLNSSSSATSSLSQDKELLEKLKNINVSITTQESGGFTEESMDIDTLKKLESWLKNMWVTKTNNYNKNNNINLRITENDISSNALFVDHENKKLAVIKMKLGIVRNVTIAGFSDNSFKRVTCMRATDSDIPLTYGACSEKIKEAFNVSLP